jgi:transcriptional regulator with XRE-family HTH domain
MALGRQVRKYREQLGWTLLQLEEHSGVDTGTISALEARDSSRSKYSAALARAMGLTLDQLLDETNTYAASSTPLASDRPGVYAIPKRQPNADISISMAISALASHMTGLDPPLRAAIGALVCGVCTDPNSTGKAVETVHAMLAVQGNGAAQKSIKSQGS